MSANELQPSGLFSAELTEDLGEESDIPSWLTADWMTKHEVSEQSR